MRARRRVGWILGPIARTTIGDELLDLAQILASCGRDPRGLGRWRRDAGQLAHGRKRELVGGERSGELRKVTKRTSHAQPILRGARSVAEDALEVVER